jgi:transcriptional regulator with XRE-family HTH domain
MPATSTARRPRKRPSDHIQLLRRVKEIRQREGLSFADVSEQSGYYSRGMIWVLERSLSAAAPVKPGMSKRGAESLRRWVEAKA